MSEMFGPGPSLHVDELVEVEPRDDAGGLMDGYRWQVTISETGTERASSGELLVQIAGSQFWIGEHEDVSTWIAWSLGSTHPYDRRLGDSWIEQLQAVQQPIELLRGLNRE